MLDYVDSSVDSDGRSLSPNVEEAVWKLDGMTLRTIKLFKRNYSKPLAFVGRFIYFSWTKMALLIAVKKYGARTELRFTQSSLTC